MRRNHTNLSNIQKIDLFDLYRFEGFLAAGDLQFSNKTGVRFAQKSYKSFKYSKIDLFDLYRFEGFLATGDLQFSPKATEFSIILFIFVAK